MHMRRLVVAMVPLTAGTTVSSHFVMLAGWYDDRFKSTHFEVVRNDALLRNRSVCGMKNGQRCEKLRLVNDSALWTVS